MAKNTLVINCDIGETRVALIENGILAELHLERRQQKGIVGNIYLGRVSRVLPGMQAAFIDIGEERAAFLHVEDLIRPADFDAYLAGSKQREGERRERLRDRPEEHTGDPSVLEGDEESDIADATDEEIEAAASASDDESIDEVDEVEELEGASADGDAEPRSEDDVVHMEAPKDTVDMATRRGRRRRGGRSGQKREEITADAQADGEFAPLPEAGATVAADDDEDLVAPTPVAAAPVNAPATESAKARPSRTPRARRTTPPPAPEGAEVAAIGKSDGGDVTPAIDPISGVEVKPIRTESMRGARGGDRGDRGDRGGDRGRPPREARRDERGKSGDRGAPKARGDRSSHDRGADKSGDKGSRDVREGHLKLGRSTPINEVVKEGQEVVVQVTKDPISSKGARVSSHVSLPGRYVVYVPTVDHIGVSRRIGNDLERRRLREAIEAMKPPQGGLIVRTLAEGLTKKQLKADVGYLVRLWGEIAKKKEEATTPEQGKHHRGRSHRAPKLLFQELDVVLRTARDMFTDDVEKIVIDDKEQYQRLLRFIDMFMPERAKDIELYSGDEPIFDAYGLEEEITRAMSRKVPLPSGGYLIIDQAEALTAIDVNSGRFVGKGNKDPEDTILQTNLEAVAEIAYQLRFRNIGGLIVLDLIDMERASNREKVYRALEHALMGDKARTSINRISELGLVEMTRKRTRESLGRTLHEPCFYCDGTGHLQSRTTVAYEIFRQIRRERTSLSGFKVIVNAHPSVIEIMQTEERDTLKEAERRYQRQIMLVPRKEYHLEQFDLGGS